MTLSLNTLDLTGFKQKGQALHEAIVSECKRIHKTGNAGFSLPQYNLIKMTQDQYDDLIKLSRGMVDQFHDDSMMYRTPYNVMEVRVDQRKRLTFTEAMSLDDKNFNEWEKETSG